MTVAELKDFLKQIPDDAMVWAYHPYGDLVPVSFVDVSRSEPGDYSAPTGDAEHTANLKDPNFGKYYRDGDICRDYQERIDKNYPITHIIMETWKS